MSHSPYAEHLIERTAHGYSLNRIEAVKLPPRQSLALLYKSAGLTQGQIAEEMDCSADNARNLIRELHFKLQTTRETALIARAFLNGYLRLLNFMAAAFLIGLTTLSNPASASRDPDQLRVRHRPGRTHRTRNNKKIIPWWDEEQGKFFIDDYSGGIKPWQ
ncbi:helix-turn-helix transcriptional regulator [Exilibacterium tricleocarpae]|uniref:Helix-turn-helix transcriptional regulator n=1 Tax=Exilibacterium tricleocarpae TaxID=2591008 RepID=A0A545U6W4_9GAMM|nr:helix-turn-helix transcriptional regulator [Exilibacterium tricleocarpae]TQV85209.1 helix-turn-helix transcriptional regulator [Exilibacterium tricleocarpae]